MPSEPAPAAVLVRTRADGNRPGAVLDEVREWAGRPVPSGPVLVFFHGAGVDHAISGRAPDWRELAAQGRVELVVCETAWRRRHRHPPPEDWHTGSLVRFWSVVADVGRIKCLGLES